MRCIYCNTPLAAIDYCPGCGADVTLQKRIVRISNLLYNRGLEKASVRDLSGAITCLKQSLKFNKENIDARNLLGLCYFETGEVVSALCEWVISKNLMPEGNLADHYISQQPFKPVHGRASPVCYRRRARSARTRRVKTGFHLQ